jgi:hypothetical protein
MRNHASHARLLELLLCLFALTTAAILQIENGFPVEGMLYLGVFLRLAAYLLAAARWGSWLASMPAGPTLGTGLVLQAILWHLLTRGGLDATPALVIVMVPAVAWRPHEIRAALARFGAARRRLGGLGLFEVLLAVLISIGFLTQFFSALALPTGAAALAGVLFEADQALLRGIGPSPLAALIMPELLLDRTGILANLTGFVFSLILALSLDTVAHRLGLTRRARLLVLAVLATSPFLGLRIAETGSAPRLLTLFGAASALIAASVHAKQSRSGAAAGGQAVPPAPGRALFGGAAAIGLLVGTIGAALIGAPAIESSWLDVIRLETMAPILCGLGLFSVGRRRPALFAVALPLGILTAVGAEPLLTIGILLPLLPFGAREIIDGAGRGVRVLLVVALIISLGVMIGRLERARGFLLLHSSAMPFIQYYLEQVKTCGIQTAGDEQLPREARVLSIGESRLFFLHRRAETADEGRLAFDPTETRERLKAWRAEGFTHLLFSPGTGSARLAPETEAALRAAVLDLDAVIADARTGMGLYRLPEGESAR